MSNKIHLNNWYGYEENHTELHKMPNSKPKRGKNIQFTNSNNKKYSVNFNLSWIWTVLLVGYWLEGPFLIKLAVIFFSIIDNTSVEEYYEN